MESISNFVKKHKNFLFENERLLYLSLIIIFVAISIVGSIFLEDFKTPPVNIVIPEATSSILVASKNGSKYHFPWCSGALRIREENKLVFGSREEALEAGYTPASNCKGLD